MAIGPTHIERPLIAFLILLSTLYLATEVAFTSYLIDFLGAARTSEDIQTLENSGRMLTGIAVALFFFRPIINFSVKKGGFSWLTLFTVLVALPTTFFISYKFVASSIEQVVVHYTDLTTPNERREALIVSSVINSLYMIENENPLLTLNGDFIPVKLRKNNESRVVLASLPFLLLNVNDLEERVLTPLENTIRRNVLEKLGTAQHSYNDMFVKPMHDLIGPTYNGWVKAINAYRQARFEMTHLADQQFDEYREELALHHITINFAKSHPAVGKRVADKMIAKNPKFRPICARKGVPDSVIDFEEVINQEIEDQYNIAVGKLHLAGIALPTGNITLADFIRTPQARNLWKDKVADKVGDVELASRLNSFGPKLGASNVLFPAFNAAVIHPVVEDMVKERMANLTADVSKYTENDPLGKRAYSAMKGIIAIPFAIIFSMGGAIMHATKISALLINFFILNKIHSWLAAFLIMTSVVIAITFNGTPDFERLTVADALRGGLRALPIGEAMLNNTVAVQSRLYPIGVEIREISGFYNLPH